MKKLIFIFFLLPIWVSAQTISTTGSPTMLSKMRGGLIMDSITVLPVRNLSSIYPLVQNIGRIQVNSLDALPYYHNGVTWVNLLSFNNLVNRPPLYPPAAHTQPISSVIGLPDSLAKYQPKGSYLISETDPSVPGYIKAVTSADLSNWNAAFGWGNHATQNYLKTITNAMVLAAIGYTPLASFTETDPTVPGYVKAINSANITNWNTSFGWGNHASEGYLKTITNAQVLTALGFTPLSSFTETDPTVSAAIKAISGTNISNWNTSFGWGNHSTQGYLKSITSAQVLAALGFTPISSFTETDPLFDTKFAGKTSSDLTEGSKLFFTAARARNTLSAGTGISYDPNTGGITNSSPDQAVTLTAGAGINITGSYPNFTVSLVPPILNTSPARTVNTNFTISATRSAFVFYPITCSATNPLLVGSSTATAFLEYSLNTGTTWLPATQASNSSSVGISVTLQLKNDQTGVISGVIPAGALVRIRTVVSGTAVVTLLSSGQTEWINSI